MIKFAEAEEEMVFYCGANMAIFQDWAYDLAMNGVRDILDLDFGGTAPRSDVISRGTRQGYRCLSGPAILISPVELP
jgi:hypothetical protein